MYNFEKFKATQCILEATNIELAGSLMFLVDCMLEPKNGHINEAKEATANDWMTDPKGMAKDKLKGIPVVGGLFNAISNAAAEKEIKQASQKWEKAYTAQEGSIFKIYLLNDKAAANGKGKTPAEISKEEGAIKAKYKEIIDAADKEWGDAIDGIEDNDNLKKERSKEKTVEQAKIKAKIAQTLIKKNEDIAIKKLGYSEEQIAKFKEVIKDGIDDIDALEKEAEATNTDETKDMSKDQKAKAEEIAGKLKKALDIAQQVADNKNAGASYTEDGEEKSKKLNDYIDALAAYQKGIGTKADEWDGPDHGKPEGFDEKEEEAKGIVATDIVEKVMSADDKEKAEEEYNKVKNNKPTSKARIQAYINLLKAKGGNDDKIKELRDTLKNGKTPEGEKLTESFIAVLESILFE